MFVAKYKINNQNEFDKKMRSAQFFNKYFSKFKYIFLSNMFFVIFNLLAAGYIYLTFVIFKGLNIFAALGSMIILNFGMSGVIQISRYIYIDKQFSTFKAFVKGLKENGLKFLVHGIFFYAFTVVTYVSIMMYYNGTKENALFWMPLVITILISLLVLFGCYYLNLMTVTMDIGLKNIYRNCALFSFGELKNNIFATTALLILGAVIFTACVIINNPVGVLVLLAVLEMFFIPATVQYIITFYIYDSMVEILDDSKKISDEENEINEKNFVSARQSVDLEEAEEISRLLPESKDEYIFHNGKMVKRSEVEKKLNDKLDDDF